MPYIEVENITKKYGKINILSGISLSVEKGECIAIVGANGCGKSTLLNILAGTMKADGGRILYNGTDSLKYKKAFSSFVGFVPQENPLLDKLSVLDNLRFWYCDTERNLKEDMSVGIPARFGLSAYRDYPVEKLSGGMKKRLSIACALAKEPPLLILDEPGASLDIVCKEDIKNYLKDYRSKGGTVVITSHEEAELSICDRMYLLERGNLHSLEGVVTAGELLHRMKTGGFYKHSDIGHLNEDREGTAE